MEFYFHELDKNVLILSADGGLNASTADQFVTQLEHLIDAGIHRIIVDCSALEYISSYGLAILMRLHKRLARHGGDVRLAAVKGLLARALTVTHLDHVFSIYPDVNRARLSFRPAEEEHKP